MWGNTQGWIIATVLLALIAAGTWQAGQYNHPTAATSMGRAATNFQPLALAVDPASIVSMTASGDTAAIYRRVIADVQSNSAAYDAFERSTDPAVGKRLPGVKALLEAAPLAGNIVLGDNPAGNIGYYRDARPDDLVHLERALSALERTGLLLQAEPYDRPEEAKKYFEAEFTTGARMFAERLRFTEAAAGLGRMTAAATMLRQIAAREKDADRIRQLEAFEADVQTLLNGRMTPMWKTIYLTDDRLVARHIGDAFAFASPQMRERLWRIEAILHLGRLQHNAGGTAGRAADQLAVKPALSAMQHAETDPAIQAAITAAQNCTIQQFRTY